MGFPLATTGTKGEDYIRTTRPAVLFEEHIRVCPDCGWWITFRETVTSGPKATVTTYGGVGALKVLDLSDIQTPLNEIRQYLTAHYDDRFSANPRLFKETVASVFGNLAYRPRATAYSGDDGVDVIFDGSKNDTIGVQVKRYRGKIGVAQIRELTGALLINGHTRGIFVTTSDFESGATSRRWFLIPSGPTSYGLVRCLLHTHSGNTSTPISAFRFRAYLAQTGVWTVAISKRLLRS